jgi:hypothetical protein
MDWKIWPKMLLDRNADVNAQNLEGKTPLHTACIYRRAKILQMLLDKGADQAIKDRENYLPYDYAQQLHGGWAQGQAILFEDLRREYRRQQGGA